MARALRTRLVWLRCGCCSATDPTGAQAKGVLSGTREVQVQQALVRSLRPGDHVWDVGANIAYISLAAARLVGPSGRVLAIEPDAASGDALRASARLNGFTQIELEPAAAAASSGTTELLVVSDRQWSRLAAWVTASSPSSGPAPAPWPWTTCGPDPVEDVGENVHALCARLNRA